MVRRKRFFIQGLLGKRKNMLGQYPLLVLLMAAISTQKEFYSPDFKKRLLGNRIITAGH